WLQPGGQNRGDHGAARLRRTAERFPGSGRPHSTAVTRRAKRQRAMSAELPAFPRAFDDDEDDVAWPLQTAAVQWERGGAADAIVWLRRAAEAAAESGKYSRSADLQRRANELDHWLKQGPSFSLDNDGDDGVDSLLAAEAPDIET